MHHTLDPHAWPGVQPLGQVFGNRPQAAIGQKPGDGLARDLALVVRNVVGPASHHTGRPPGVDQASEFLIPHGEVLGPIVNCGPTDPPGGQSSAQAAALVQHHRGEPRFVQLPCGQQARQTTANHQAG